MKTISKITYPALALFAHAMLALSPQARATCQEGCDPANNTFLGDDALVNNTLGGNNAAVGTQALFSNKNGNYNTAIGYQALYSNTTGFSNMASGANALQGNTTGFNNTASGSGALLHNINGDRNTATGVAALELNNGSYNTATGDGALLGNQIGDNNTASGYLALALNNIGGGNTATGSLALQSNQAGSNNTAEGANALYNATGNNNIALGGSAGLNLTTGDDNIDIGNAGFGGESGAIRIGTEGTHTGTYIAGIRQAPLVRGAAVAVGITPDGQLGVRASAARFKEAVKPMDKTSEAIFSLQPVTFHYKKDPDAVPQFGLVAEQVATVKPDLVTCDTEGKPYTVRYEEVNAMLLNEFLKEHKKVEQQASDIAQLKSALAEVTARLDAKRP